MKVFKITLCLIALVSLSACLSSDQETDLVNEETAQIRVVHASPDAPTVGVLANGELLGFVAGTDYQQTTDNFIIESGVNYDLVVQGNTSAGSVPVLNASITPEAHTSYNIIALGSVAGDSLELLTISNIDEDLPEGNVRAQVVHVAEDAPMVDIYITAVDADLTSAQAVATLGYRDYSGTVEVEGGEYQIRITPAGLTTIAFDSGPITLPANSELLVLATSNVASGEAPVSLVVANGSDSSIVLDKDTPASIRVVHGVADAPAVDVIANNALELFNNASFMAVTDYGDVDADDYLIDIAAASDNSIVVIDDAEITLVAGQRYTAIANNELASIDLDLIVDTPRPIATDAQLRLFHAASFVGDVDVYITSDGNIANVDASVTDLPYQTGELSETGYVLISEGDYVITVTPANTKTVALETTLVSLQANQIYTAFVVNGESADAAPNLIVADDFEL